MAGISSVDYEVVQSGYLHLHSGYLGLARHYAALDDRDNEALFREKCRQAMTQYNNLYRSTPEALTNHQMELLPPVIEELHYLQTKILGRRS